MKENEKRDYLKLGKEFLAAYKDIIKIVYKEAQIGITLTACVDRNIKLLDKLITGGKGEKESN